MLASSVPCSKNWAGVCKRLGLSSKNSSRLRKRAIQLGIDFSHFSWKRKYDAESLRLAVQESLSYRQVLIHLGMNAVGSAYYFIKAAIKKCGYDTSHFLGASSNRGKIIGPKRPIDDYLSGRFNIGSHKLKIRLIKEKIFEDKCTMCGLTEWLNKKMPLELDHIDGNRDNNQLINLRLLCPNCHTLTPTYRGRNTFHKVKIKKEKIKKEKKREKRLNGVEVLCRFCGKSFRRRKGAVKFKNYCCIKCFNSDSRKCVRPTKEELEEQIKIMPFTKIGKKYGVSDNAVKKWARSYSIDLPNRLGYWAKLTKKNNAAMVEW